MDSIWPINGEVKATKIEMTKEMYEQIKNKHKDFKPIK